jgi:putative hemolysin
MFGQLGIESNDISYAAVEDSGPKQAFIRLMEPLSGQPRLFRIYDEARKALRPGDDIFGLAVRRLELKVRFDAERLAAVPKTGPLVVVANHPFGVVDGLVLCHLVAMVRPDFKVMAMSTLCRVPEVRDHVLPINFANTREAVATSARSRATARAHLRAGGCLIIFPAGEVSTARHLFGPAVDAPWHPFVGRLVQGSGASVLPVRFTGQNSLLFQLASRISPTLRLSLLLHEARSRIGTEIEAHLGEVLPYEALRPFTEPGMLVAHLRAVTHGIPAAAAGLAAHGDSIMAGRERRLMTFSSKADGAGSPFRRAGCPAMRRRARSAPATPGPGSSTASGATSTERSSPYQDSGRIGPRS